MLGQFRVDIAVTQKVAVKWVLAVIAGIVDLMQIFLSPVFRLVQLKAIALGRQVAPVCSLRNLFF